MNVNSPRQFNKSYNATKEKSREDSKSYLCCQSEGGRRAQGGENSNCREKGFEDDEQCKDAEGMDVTVG